MKDEKNNTFFNWVEAMGTFGSIEQIEGLYLYRSILTYEKNGSKNKIEVRFSEKYKKSIAEKAFVYVSGYLHQIFSKKIHKFVIFANEIREIPNLHDDDFAGYASVYMGGLITNVTCGKQGVVFNCEIKNPPRNSSFKCFAYGHNAVRALNEHGFIKIYGELTCTDENFVKITVSSISGSGEIKAPMDKDTYKAEAISVCRELHIMPEDLNIMLFAYAKSKGLFPPHSDSEGRLIAGKSNDFITYINTCGIRTWEQGDI